MPLIEAGTHPLQVMRRYMNSTSSHSRPPFMEQSRPPHCWKETRGKKVIPPDAPYQAAWYPLWIAFTIPPVVKRVSTPTLGSVSQQGVPSFKMRSSNPGTPPRLLEEEVDGMGDEVVDAEDDDDDDDDDDDEEGEEVVDHIWVPSTHHLSPMQTKGTGVGVCAPCETRKRKAFSSM